MNQATGLPQVQADELPLPSRPVAFLWHYICARPWHFGGLLALIIGAASCAVAVQYGMKLLVDAMAQGTADRGAANVWWPLGLFRRLMGVEDSAYYENFKQLNAKIIKPAVAEVNKSSNIVLSPEFRKQGRAVTELRFLIRENPQLAMFDIDDGEGVRSSDTYKRLVEMGVSDRLARQWIAEHGEAHVRGKLDYVTGQDGVKSPVRYLAAALRDDYAGPEGQGGQGAPSPEAIAAAERRAEAAARARAEEAAREAEVALARRERAAKLARVRELAEARNPTQRSSDKRLFLSRLEGELERADFARHGWASALNARAICAFWEELQPGVFDETG